MNQQLRDAYLARLGLAAEPPSADALQMLHRRHVERVPYETLWIHGGEAWDIDPAASVQRIALGGRGGYCYHLNGALAALLHTLGYDVHQHCGGVHGPTGPNEDSVGNHLVLTVRGLPNVENPGGVWYVDAGLGDALYEPLPLAPGEHLQEPFTMALARTEAESGWHLQHDPAGGFAGMGWTADEADWEVLRAKHEWLSTSPDSGFVQVGMAECRDATGVDVIRGLIRSRIGSDARVDEPITRRSDWFEVLREVFGLRFDSTPPETQDRLWTRMLANHRAWEAAARP